MHRLRRKYIEIIACVLALACLTVSISRCAALLADTEANAKSTDAALAMQIGSDMRMWINAVGSYQVTGELYERPSSADETIESLYAPMTPRARFTPFFHTQMIPMAKSQNPEVIITLIRKAMIAAYFLACFGFAMRISALLRRQGQPRIRILLFYTLAAIAATSNYGFQDAVRITNYEIFIFSLLIASFLLFENHPKFSAVIIGFLGCAKFYPAFMAIFLLTRCDKKVIFTLILSVSLFFLTGLMGFGLKENLFYWMQAFPVILSEDLAPILYNMSFGGAIFRYSQNIEFTKVAFQIYRLILLGLTFILLVKNYESPNKSGVGVFALLVTLMLICLPNYWQTYLIMLLPAFCVAIYRVVIRPNTTATFALLICMASMATDNNSWVQFGAPAWFAGSVPPDEAGSRIIEALQHQREGFAHLLFAWYYPRTAFLFFLEHIKFVVPAILWLFVAREIISPAFPQNSH